MKNIDKLFQEKLQNFEASPNENIWKNIESSLKEKEEKRRIIPFWWKFSGVAALLIVGFFVGNKLNDNSSIKKQIEIENSDANAVISNEKNKFNQGVSASEKVDSNTKIDQSEIEKNYNQNQVSSSENNIISNQKSTKNKPNSLEKSISITENVSKEKNNQIAKISNKTSLKSTKKDNIVFSNNSITESVNKKYETISNNKNSTVSTVSDDNKSQNLTENTSKELKNSVKNQSNSIETKIANSDNQLKNDSTTTTAFKTNKLEELLAEKEAAKNKKKPTETSRWQISSTIAPIVFGSTSNDSPVDSKYNSNSKNYNNNLSYGLGLQYNLTKKIALRTGINKLLLDYTTNDVAFLENTQSVESLVAVSTENNIQFVSEGLNAVDTFTLASSQINKGSLRQEFGYIEVPIEFSYAVIDKKFKINIISGISSLFLNQNNISLSSQKFNQSIGEANNINKVNFSTNVGLGLNYNLYKTFYLNLDSLLKYQLNTFNDNSGNFNPYIIGFYSGISYKF